MFPKSNVDCIGFGIDSADNTVVEAQFFVVTYARGSSHCTVRMLVECRLNLAVEYAFEKLPTRLAGLSAD